MIFINAELEAKTRNFVGKYYPKRYWPDLHDDDLVTTHKILALKSNSGEALDYFYAKIEPKLRTGFSIVVVPSHEANLNPDASRKRCVPLLATRLAAAEGKDRVDATSCLVRHLTVAKLASGGPRDKSVHLDSIRVENKNLIHGKDILLLDDVFTSGGSCEACEELLMDAGAHSIRFLALGRTTYPEPSS